MDWSVNRGRTYKREFSGGIICIIILTRSPRLVSQTGGEGAYSHGFWMTMRRYSLSAEGHMTNAIFNHRALQCFALSLQNVMQAFVDPQPPPWGTYQNHMLSLKKKPHKTQDRRHSLRGSDVIGLGYSPRCPSIFSFMFRVKITR